MHALVFLFINQYTKFKVHSFTSYKDILRYYDICQNLEVM